MQRTMMAIAARTAAVNTRESSSGYEPDELIFRKALKTRNLRYHNGLAVLFRDHHVDQGDHDDHSLATFWLQWHESASEESTPGRQPEGQLLCFRAARTARLGHVQRLVIWWSSPSTSPFYVLGDQSKIDEGQPRCGGKPHVGHPPDSRGAGPHRSRRSGGGERRGTVGTLSRDCPRSRYLLKSTSRTGPTARAPR